MGQSRRFWPIRAESALRPLATCIADNAFRRFYVKSRHRALSFDDCVGAQSPARQAGLFQKSFRSFNHGSMTASQ